MPSITESLSALQRDEFINSFEADSAFRAEASGTPAHTIGHELEVLRSVRPDIPKLQQFDPSDIPDTFYGYTADRDEGMYEVQSPPAQHPLAAAVALSGIARLGWLPKRTKGVVTAHINIGAEAETDLADRQERLIMMLRTIELLGHTTSNRLLSPERQAAKFIQEGSDWDLVRCGWNARGSLGVSVNAQKVSRWQGSSQRIELRTLGYYSPEQFGRTLHVTYHLSRGLLAPERSAAAQEYIRLEDWVQDYFTTKGLPAAPAASHELPNQQEVAGYIRLYAQHLAEGDLGEFRARTQRTVANLEEEFGTAIDPTRAFFHGVLQRVL